MSPGNICSQLHVHVTGRFPGDAAWPGPVRAFACCGRAADWGCMAVQLGCTVVWDFNLCVCLLQCYGVGAAEPHEPQQLQQLLSELRTAIQDQLR